MLRALGYSASVSSSFADNPVSIKEEICSAALSRISSDGIKDPLDIIRYTGDPMMPVALGMIKSYTGNLILAGGTQMLAVAALSRALGLRMPWVVTTCYVRDDPTANVQHLAEQIRVRISYVDPDSEIWGTRVLHGTASVRSKRGSVQGVRCALRIC